MLLFFNLSTDSFLLTFLHYHHASLTERAVPSCIEHFFPSPSSCTQINNLKTSDVPHTHRNKLHGPGICTLLQKQPLWHSFFIVNTIMQTELDLFICCWELMCNFPKSVCLAFKKNKITSGVTFTGRSSSKKSQQLKL